MIVRKDDIKVTVKDITKFILSLDFPANGDSLIQLYDFFVSSFTKKLKIPTFKRNLKKIYDPEIYDDLVMVYTLSFDMESDAFDELEIDRTVDKFTINRNYNRKMVFNCSGIINSLIKFDKARY